jgi:hypothetical protein
LILPVGFYTRKIPRWKRSESATRITTTITTTTHLVPNASRTVHFPLSTICLGLCRFLVPWSTSYGYEEVVRRSAEDVTEVLCEKFIVLFYNCGFGAQRTRFKMCLRGNICKFNENIKVYQKHTTLLLYSTSYNFLLFKQLIFTPFLLSPNIISLTIQKRYFLHKRSSFSFNSRNIPRILPLLSFLTNVSFGFSKHSRSRAPWIRPLYHVSNA